MAKYLKEFDIYDVTGGIHNPMLNNQSRCVVGLFEKKFGKLETTHKIRKINIILTNEFKGLELMCGDGTADIQMIYDVTNYYSSDNETKKKLILDIIRKGYERVVKLLKLPRDNFDKAYTAVQEANFLNSWTWGKPKSNPTKSYYAKIFCKHELERFSIYLIILDSSKKETKKIKLIDEVPNEFIFAKYFGSLEWISDDTVSFTSKDESIVWTYNTKKMF